VRRAVNPATLARLVRQFQIDLFLVAIFIIKPILEIRILFLLVVAIVFIDLFVAGMIPARRDPARDRIPSLAYRPERCRDADDLDSARP
jgi:hypothetical protein